MEGIRQQEAASIKRFTDMQNKLAAKSATLQIKWWSTAGAAFTKILLGQTKGHAGWSAFFVETTADAVSTILKAYASLWAAEAAANAITNPPVAATKARAAALAGVAAGVVAAAGAAAAESIRGRADESAEIDEGLTGAEGGARGRTLVARGPTTLNYTATMVVNGHVFDTADVFEMFDQFNRDQVRRAGFDSEEIARG
jgi:hypothetical protein